MAQHHFLQVSTRSTHTSPLGITACFPVGGGQGRPPRRFVEGRWLAHMAGRSADPRSIPVWPLRHGSFFRACRWIPCWLLTSAVQREVRTGTSVRARTRTGRIWPVAPPFCCLTVSCWV